MRKYIILILIFTFTLCIFQGCSKENSAQKGAAATQQPKKTDALETITPTPAPSQSTTTVDPAASMPPDQPVKTQNPAATASPIQEQGPQIGKTIPILYYHAIDDDTFGMEELFVRPAEFEKQMDFLQRNGYTPITFEQLEDAGRYQKPVLITFDDGYENNYTKAYPILKKYGFKATIFLTASFLDGGSMLRKSDIPKMLDVFSIQSHTLTHPDLRALNRDEMEKELAESKRLIEELTGKKVTAFAYPTGYYNQAVLSATKKYYKYGVQNGGGLYTIGDSLLEMKRVYIPRNLDIKGFEQKIRTGMVK